MADKRTAICSLGFIALISLTGLTLLVKKSRTYSENENRYLQTRPAFSLSDIADGTWQADITEYMSDQMPFRDAWTALQAKTQLLLGKRDINGVYVGKEKRYFEKITDDDLSRTRIQTNLTAILKTAQSQPQTPVSVMLVPSAGNVQPQYLPKHAELYNGAYLAGIAQSMLGGTCTLVDVSTALKSHNSEEIYYHTDHHWTSLGAYYGYEAFAKSQGFTPRSLESMGMKTVSEEFLGTLYSKVLDKSTQPDRVEIRGTQPVYEVTADGKQQVFYDMSALSRKDHYEVFFGGNYGEVQIETPAASGKKLLIFKDSYANCFVPYLLEDYAEITMIDLRYNDGTWVDRLHENNDAVLFLYEMSNFAQDVNVSAMLASLGE